MAPRKKVAPVSVQKLTGARLLNAKTYNPDISHAKEVFDALDEDLKREAFLSGKDERNFATYGKIEFSTREHATEKARQDAMKMNETQGLTKAEIKRDFREMGMAWTEPKPKPAAPRTTRSTAAAAQTGGANQGGGKKVKTEVVDPSPRASLKRKRGT